MRLSTLLLTLVLTGSAVGADMGSPIPTPETVPTPPPVVPPKPAPKMEYRLIDGRLYYVPSDSPWTTPSIPAVPNCPDGRCPLPNR